MGIKGRLTLMNFLEFFIWGAWLITIGNYWFYNKGWEATEFGIIFSTMGIASLFMPALMGMVADRWMNAEKLFGILHILGGLALFYIPQINSPYAFFWGILVAMIFYMPTIALANSIAYTTLKNNGQDVIKAFPPIRVWGTVGFIAAMWFINLTGNKASENQFYIAGIAAILLGLYSFTLPKCPPQNTGSGEKKSMVQILGLDAFRLFKDKRMLIFFLFAMALGAALQLTNAYGDAFLNSFASIPKYADSFVVKYSTIIMSISQMSETLFILAIPFFMKRFGIKNVMLMSMLAWALRFALFGFGNPTDGLWMIILSCIIYGMAFDFFNISGSLYVETTVNPSMRSSGQGMFMMMTNGVGAIIGSLVSGYAIAHFFTKEVIIDGHVQKVISNWPAIWFSFAIYAIIIAIAFVFLFKYKHDPNKAAEIRH
jgi:NHS family xanthosine MFS transporter